MTLCPFNDQLGAYLDGEVDETRRAEIGEHVRNCSACAAELNRLQALSGVLESGYASSIAKTRLSQIGLHRLHRRIDQAMEEGFLRFVRVFNAVAACVLVAGSAWLMMKTRENGTVEKVATPAAPPWVDVSYDTPSGAYSTPAAAWYLADDSTHADEKP